MARLAEAYNEAAPGAPRTTVAGSEPMRTFPIPLAVALAIAGLAQAPRGTLDLLRLEDEGLMPGRWPSPWQSHAPIMAGDLDSDGTAETVAVSSGRATIRVDARDLWSSPAHWEVLQARITDLDWDGVPEVSILVWRDFEPWPIDAYIPRPGRISSFHDEAGRSCHLILVGRREDGYGELWAGSALSRPISAFEPADLDGDGRQDLVTLEASYDQPPFVGNAVGVWQWNGFGFSLRARSARADFTRFSVIGEPEGPDALLVESTPWR